MAKKKHKSYKPNTAQPKGNVMTPPAQEESNVPATPMETAADTLGNTRRWARQLHGSQKDKSSKPYVTHLDAVASGVWALTQDKELVQAAYLHDVLEDTNATKKDLLAQEFSERTIAAVEAVTKGNGERNDIYVGRLIEAGVDGMWVKLADLYHNTREDRLKGLIESTQIRLREKYYPAIWRIESALVKAGVMSEDERTMTFDRARAAVDPALKPKPKVAKTTTKPQPKMPDAPEGKRWAEQGVWAPPLKSGDKIKLNREAETLTVEAFEREPGKRLKIRTSDGVNHEVVAGRLILVMKDAVKPVKATPKTPAKTTTPPKTASSWRDGSPTASLMKGDSFRWSEADPICTITKVAKVGAEIRLTVTEGGVEEDIVLKMKDRFQYRWRAGTKTAGGGTTTTYTKATWQEYMGLPKDWKDPSAPATEVKALEEAK